ncbi:MAG TPA: hypothetical protein VK034_07920, partial [Enhygromyxa sp.]|nr:hypothetical protein [Enhygromyxa sp.]
MAKDQLESKDSSLFPSSDEREDSGLQDILSVAAKLKDEPDDDLSDPEDASGVILFRAGDLEGDDKPAEAGDALFGGFGGLGAGFETPVEPPTSPDLTPLGGAGAVSESSPAEVSKPPEEPKRNPLAAVAVVLGLGLAAVGLVFLTNGDKEPTQQQQAQAELSASDEAAVGKAEPTPEDDPAAASAGQPQPEPEPEPE